MMRAVREELALELGQRSHAEQRRYIREQLAAAESKPASVPPKSRKR